jgi:hypothetical protein
MSDSRLKSLTENLTNIVVGFPISYFSNFLILPYYAKGIAVSDPLSLFMIGVWYTIFSVVRQYLFRRLFNKFGERENFYTLSVRLYKKIREITGRIYLDV